MKIAATVIVWDKDLNGRFKYLITKRSMDEKKFPGLWTVPGGKLEKEDIESSRPVGIFSYDVLNRTAIRECLEETGIQIREPINYLTSIVYEKDDGLNLIISFYTRNTRITKINPKNSKWIYINEINSYSFIEGITNEIIEVDQKLSGRQNARNHN